MIEIEISGFEVIVDIPLGDGQDHDGCAEIRRTESSLPTGPPEAKMKKKIQREIPPDPLSARRESCSHAGDCYICKSKIVEDICGKDKPANLWELDPNTLFTMEDRKKKAGKERMCRCVKEEVYIPTKPIPTKPTPTPEYEDDYPSIDIITSPRTTCICKCVTCGGMKPVLPEHEYLSCIQYKSLQVFKEVRRHLTIRNTSELKSKYSIFMRRFGMGATKSKFRGGGVEYPGLAIWFHKYQGVIAPEAVVDIDMNIYADCFGLYYDQMLIKMDYVTPIIIDVWVEAIGSPLLPLSFNLNPVAHPMTLPILPDQKDIESMGKPSTLWVSDNDEKRTIRVRNVSRTPMLVRPFIAKNREPLDSILPFRLYLSFLDELPRYCPCVLETDTELSETLSTNLTSPSTKEKSYTESKTESKWDSKSESKWDSKLESKGDSKSESKTKRKDESKVEREYTRDEMDTRVIVYLGPDYGKQDYTYYAVSTVDELFSEELVQVEPGAIGEFSIRKAEQDDFTDELDEIIDPKYSLLLTMEPLDICGKGWYRFNMDPLVVNIRRAARAPQLQLDTDKITAYINAIELPFDDTMRIRKYIHIMNTGTGPMTLNIKTDGPWWVLESKLQNHPGMSCGHGCRCRWLADSKRESYPKHSSIYLKLPPYSNYQMCLEIEINTNSIWPKTTMPTTHWIPTENSEVTLHTVNNVSERKLFNNKLQFYKDQDLIKIVPLDLAIDYPRLIVEPVAIDLGFITDGDTKKTFFTVKHTSQTLPLDISCEWIGSVHVKHHPRHLHIPPEHAGTVYLQYTARWTSAPLEGRFMIKVYSGASMWCQATLPVRATPTRDHKFKTAIHDHTDDKVILPPLKMLDHLISK